MGVFGKKNSGKSTFITKIFKKCETNSGYDNSTIGLNLYKFKDTKNFLILDTPGDTEINQQLENFTSKGYKYAKIFVYLMSEEKILDADSLGKNTKLAKLIEWNIQFNIPLIILLTHSDDYCDKIYKSDNDWKKICKDHFIKNKENLLNYVNGLIANKFKRKLKFDEKDIMRVVLVETAKLSKEEIIKEFDEKTRNFYNLAVDDEQKNIIIEIFVSGLQKKSNDVEEFIKKEIKVLGQKELIGKIKEKLPSQYHSALIELN